MGIHLVLLVPNIDEFSSGLAILLFMILSMPRIENVTSPEKQRVNENSKRKIFHVCNHSYVEDSCLICEQTKEYSNSVSADQQCEGMNERVSLETIRSLRLRAITRSGQYITGHRI